MSSKGFTLIEMLITVSVFGVALAALLSGLRVGAASEVRVERLLDANYEERAALELLREDLAAAALEEDNELITFGTTRNGDDLIQFFRFSFEDGLQHVRYALDPASEGTFDLIRRGAPVPLGTPVAHYVETTVLRSLQSFGFSFHDGNRWRETWETESVLPVRVRLQGKQVRGELPTPIELTVRLPAAEYFGGGDGG